MIHSELPVHERLGLRPRREVKSEGGGRQKRTLHEGRRANEPFPERERPATGESVQDEPKNDQKGDPG